MNDKYIKENLIEINGKKKHLGKPLFLLSKLISFDSPWNQIIYTVVLINWCDGKNIQIVSKIYSDKSNTWTKLCILISSRMKA